MIKNKIQVLVVEDSSLYQMYLRQVIESDDCLSVVGVADCGSRALECIEELDPDIVTLDLQLPDMDGFELLKEILQRWDLPVIEVSGDADACEKAIRLGARDFIEKISDAKPKTAEQFRLLLKLKLKMQAEARTSSTRSAEARTSDTRPAEAQVNGAARPAVATPSASVTRSSIEVSDRAARAAHAPEQKPAPTDLQQASAPEQYANAKEHIIAIGASLGGTEVTLQILQRLPADLPGIVIVQHMPPEYTSAYALRLDRYCDIAVHEATNGDQVLPGTALVARGGRQLKVYRANRGFSVELGGSERFGGFCPSVDVMFRSVAETAGFAALGVILTGMGKDGAEGLKQMHDAQAYTLGQNEESCAVFGMPGAAWKLGGADKLLPPDMIADEIVRYCSRYQRSKGERI